MKLERGCVQVYTGNGKGKTTASLGLALRATGHGLRVCMIQFMKGGGPYGEHAAAKKLSDKMTIHRTGGEGWVTKGDPAAEDVLEARKGLEKARSALVGGEYDLVVLDEVNGAVDFGLLPVEEVLSLLDLKPQKVELVMTGRNAHPSVIEAADLVTEMREVKHYFRQGVPAREGVER